MWSYVFLMFCEVEVYVPGCVSVRVCIQYRGGCLNSVVETTTNFFHFTGPSFAVLYPNNIDGIFTARGCPYR